MGFDIICDLPHIIGDGHRNGWPHNYGKEKTMENQNANLADLVQPQDAEIEALQAELVRVKEELIVAKTWGADRSRADDLKADQLDRLGDAIMALIGDKVEALAEAKADDAVDGAFRDFNNDFNIYDHQSEIDDMINDRLPAVQDEDENREAVESIVREILAGATVTIDV